MKLTRRGFLRLLGLAPALAALPVVAQAPQMPPAKPEFPLHAVDGVIRTITIGRFVFAFDPGIPFKGTRVGYSDYEQKITVENNGVVLLEIPARIPCSVAPSDRVIISGIRGDRHFSIYDELRRGIQC